MDFIYLLAYGAIFGIVGIASRFVPLFFGEGYDPVVPLLYCMVPLILIIGTSNCLGSQYFTPSGQRKRSAKVIVLGACINLCFNLLLIPRFLAYGATVASVIAELTIAVLYVQMSGGYIRWGQLWAISYRKITAGVLMLLLIWWIGAAFPLHGVSLIILQVIAGAACYGLVLLALRDKMMTELVHMAWGLVRKVLKKVF